MPKKKLHPLEIAYRQRRDKRKAKKIADRLAKEQAEAEAFARLKAAQPTRIIRKKQCA